MNPKMLILAPALLCVIGAGPLVADLDGTWAGEGKGVCSPPPGSPSDFPIYAWQVWKGRVEGKTSFQGSWYDNRGNDGVFVGSIVYITEEEAYCEGEWSWYDHRYDPPWNYYMGPFGMHFYFYEGSCWGEWKSDFDDGGGGSMVGKWVEP